MSGVACETVPCGLCGSTRSTLLVKARDPLGIAEEEFTVVQCEGCSLAYLNPRPTPEALKAFYPEGYWWAEKEGGLLRQLEERYRKGLLQREVRTLARRLPRGSRVLDVGCGQGDMMLLLREAGYAAFGVENAPSAGTFAREVRGLKVHLGDLGTLPFPEAGFDAVTFFHVLEHLPNPLATLREARGRLHAGGWLLIQCPNIESAQFRRFGARWLHLSLPQHFYHFSPATLGKMLAKAGFRVIEARHHSLRMNPMSAVLSRHPGLIACVFPAAKGNRGSTAAEKAFYLICTYLARPRVRLESWLRRGATFTVLAQKDG